MDPTESLSRELQFRSRLLQRLGDQKIDVVVHRTGTPDRPIDREARESGVRL